MSIEVQTPASIIVAGHLFVYISSVTVPMSIELVQICSIICGRTTFTEQLTGLGYQTTDFTYQMTGKKWPGETGCARSLYFPDGEGETGTIFNNSESVREAELEKRRMFF
jgi:hypothetical protein